MSEGPNTDDYGRNKRRTLLGMVALFALYGLTKGLFPGDTAGLVDFAFALPFAALVLSWCAWD